MNIRFGQNFRINTTGLKDGQADVLSDLTSVGGVFSGTTVKNGTHGVDTYAVPSAQSDNFKRTLQQEGIKAIPVE